MQYDAIVIDFWQYCFWFELILDHNELKLRNNIRMNKIKMNDIQWVFFICQCWHGIGVNAKWLFAKSMEGAANW